MGSPRLKQLPGYTCPDIDEIIKLLESLRKDNGNLRGYAETFAEEADDAEDALEKAKDEIADLNKQVLSLERELAQANAQLDKMDAR